jgi:hypothetical protein
MRSLLAVVFLFAVLNPSVFVAGQALPAKALDKLPACN